MNAPNIGFDFGLTSSRCSENFTVNWLERCIPHRKPIEYCVVQVEDKRINFSWRHGAAIEIVGDRTTGRLCYPRINGLPSSPGRADRVLALSQARAARRAFT